MSLQLVIYHPPCDNVRILKSSAFKICHWTSFFACLGLLGYHKVHWNPGNCCAFCPIAISVSVFTVQWQIWKRTEFYNLDIAAWRMENNWKWKIVYSCLLWLKIDTVISTDDSGILVLLPSSALLVTNNFPFGCHGYDKDKATNTGLHRLITCRVKTAILWDVTPYSSHTVFSAWLTGHEDWTTRLHITKCSPLWNLKSHRIKGVLEVLSQRMFPHEASDFPEEASNHL
jgi:hypothetical protein